MYVSSLDEVGQRGVGLWGQAERSLQGGGVGERRRQGGVWGWCKGRETEPYGDRGMGGGTRRRGGGGGGGGGGGPTSLESSLENKFLN